jgi:uridine kinase
VAVTGITASGKSTLAAELSEQIRSLGEPCVSLAVDGFHQPKAIRYRRGRESAEGYYRDAYNYDSLILRVLRPLGPGGDFSYVARAFDLERDAPVEPALERRARAASQSWTRASCSAKKCVIGSTIESSSTRRSRMRCVVA